MSIRTPLAEQFGIEYPVFAFTPSKAVAAAVIGGTALAGGIGTVFGAIIGTLLIRTIDNGLVLSRVDANWFKFAIGLLTMFAVIANAWMARISRKIKVEVRK